MREIPAFAPIADEQFISGAFEQEFLAQRLYIGLQTVDPIAFLALLNGLQQRHQRPAVISKVSDERLREVNWALVEVHAMLQGLIIPKCPHQDVAPMLNRIEERRQQADETLNLFRG